MFPGLFLQRVGRSPGKSSVGRRVGSGSSAESARSMEGQHGGEGDRQSAAPTPVADEQSVIQATPAAIQATWPWMSEVSAKWLATEVAGGRCPEIAEQLRLSEQGRGQNQSGALSSVLVTCTTESGFLVDLVDAYLQLVLQEQVQTCARAHQRNLCSACALFTFDVRCGVWQSAVVSPNGKRCFDPQTDALAFLAVKKAEQESKKPHLCNPIHYCLFLLGLENQSKAPSANSVLKLCTSVLRNLNNKIYAAKRDRTHCGGQQASLG